VNVISGISVKMKLHDLVKIKEKIVGKSFLCLASDLSPRIEELNNFFDKLQIAMADRHCLIDTNLKVEQIRALSKDLHLRPHSSFVKVAVISPAENLNPACGNALLKILEEPPGKTAFFLLAQDEMALLPTIRSRCQKVMLEAKPIFQSDLSLLEIYKKPLVERFSIANDLSTREDLFNLLDIWQLEIKKNAFEKTTLIKKLIRCKMLLRATNVNKRLLLENMFLEEME